MTLPSATALHIKSRQPTTAEILAYAAARQNKWFSPRTAPGKSAEPVELPAAPREVPATTAERVWPVQHDSHMAAYWEWKGNEPLGFLKLRCREMGVSFHDIIGPSYKRIHSDPRGALMAEVKNRYPDKSLPELGCLFGGRDHSTIRTALRKHGVITGERVINRCPDLDIAKVKEMFFEGTTYRAIGTAVGCSRTTITSIVKENGWTREVAPRGIASHAEEMRTMYAAGISARKIAATIGHSYDGVRSFIRRMGWTR